MKTIFFAWTVGVLLEGRKTVTRRFWSGEYAKQENIMTKKEYKMNETEACKITRLYRQLATLKEVLEKTTENYAGVSIIHTATYANGVQKQTGLNEIDITEDEIVKLLRNACLETISKLESMDCEIDEANKIMPEKSEEIELGKMLVFKKALEKVIENLTDREEDIADDIKSAANAGDYASIYEHAQGWEFCAGEKFAYKHVLDLLEKEPI